MARSLLLLLCIGLLAGCSNRLLPPANVEDPVQVHLMDHGRHPSLLLPNKEGGWIRYVYGEWRWYADDDTGFWRGIQAMLWPTQAAIGRLSIDHLPRPGRSEAIPEGFLRLYSFEVATQRAATLRKRLDSHFEEPERQTFQPRYNLYFVPYPESYWVFNQSNQVMKRWLEELGAEVHGPGLFSEWQLEGQDGL
ncbi:hypothetical protein RE428_00790 [Marinobacter nanhaiticus D15-8W]|uniref:DUF2931 family protein n=1 Tax=Marinobacter nanhaiticus D15-8W TaxID=626887 RepID=N6WW45_9GAMM|nr:hypothetical protein [Marinobacter nanhaiticus]ENO15237.1 hypothetical protein J057_07801 [Marinobacter nanhaiticus D15-8W]BES69061.1 hypothetical protein RE428_00790 [Marinobacter nanhaiticus D15-8W]